MPPSISIRAYIKWFDDPPPPESLSTPNEPTSSSSPSLPSPSPSNLELEPTSTIVLTDSTTSHFVDLRILTPALKQPYDNVLRPEDLDWGIAGISTSTPLVDGPFQRHAVFSHEIDSRIPFDHDAPSDEGDVRGAGDGTGDEIEVGRMLNPANGRMQWYEERWREGEVLRVPGWERRRCVVLRATEGTGEREGEGGKGRNGEGEDDGKGEGEGGGESEGGKVVVKGSIVMLGQWMQGILRRGRGELFVERWKYVEADDGKEGGLGQHRLVARLGRSGFLPGPELVAKGESFSHSSIKWEVVGITEW